jgi:EAL domain-containing protein (putative c-di-GMP-specific phosphodiesterase class I)
VKPDASASRREAPPPDDPFAAAGHAAGALALTLDIPSGRIRFDGDAASFGLAADMAWSAVLDRLAVLDRPAARRIEQGGAVDVRLRMSDPANGVRFVRLIGRGDTPGVFRGLLLPAGAAPKGGARLIEREAALADAVASGEIAAFYQPVVDLRTRRLVGFEALARWRRPEEGVLNPDDFLPLAVRLGLLADVGDQVRAAALDELARWRDAGRGPVSVSVNATASELVRPGFAEALAQRAAASGAPAGTFKVEISETEVMGDPDACARAMGVLSDGGVALLLDDFGTGYSSLARLDRLPFDAIKIDQYFVRHLTADESARTIVGSVVSLARNFGMSVVAEGVESEAAAAALIELGCEQAQGFLFAGALAPADAELAVREGLPGRFAAPA